MRFARSCSMTYSDSAFSIERGVKLASFACRAGLRLAYCGRCARSRSTWFEVQMSQMNAPSKGELISVSTSSDDRPQNEQNAGRSPRMVLLFFIHLANKHRFPEVRAFSPSL